VIMGRKAGWLTASSILSRRDETDGPHLIYVPEVPVSEDQFVRDVTETYERLGRCLVAVSEGIAYEDRMLWAEKITQTQECDSHGNVQLSGSGALGDYMANLVKTRVKDNLGVAKLRVRADTFGYLQRSFPGLASPVDRREARMVGQKAVEYAMSGDIDGSVALRRTGEDANYAVECFRAELRDVARDTKSLPTDYINDAGNGINDSFLAYVAPLVGELPILGKLK